METVPSTSASDTISQKDKIYWENHVKTQRASGISRAAYCRINRVNYDRLSYWIKNNKQARQAGISLIPVRLKPAVSHQTNTGGIKTLCTLRLKNEVTISIHDKEALSLLIKEIM